MNREYQMCTRCVMDTTDPDITFDENGVCNYCHYFDKYIKPRWFPNEEGKRRLEKIIEEIKQEGYGKEYDCLIGLSGGVDSSYVALKAKEWGLRPLVLHIDTGWNSEVAVQNIERVVKYCGFDLYTHVMNWEDMKNLQVAYFRSGVANLDIPQDHAIVVWRYLIAEKMKIRYILTGANYATESIFPTGWEHHSNRDGRNIKAIFKKFGNGEKLQDYKIMGVWHFYLYYPLIKRIRVIRPLNFIPYNKKEAIKELQEKTGWRPYGTKHGESVFTRFFQNYFLIERFGYDKRKPHFSSLILSGQMTREEALKELSKPLYNPKQLEEDKRYIRKKLGLTEEEFEALLKVPKRKANEFPSQEKLENFIKKLYWLIVKIRGKPIIINT